jgi:hypothetical protein
VSFIGVWSRLSPLKALRPRTEVRLRLGSTKVNIYSATPEAKRFIFDFVCIITTMLLKVNTIVVE